MTQLYIHNAPSYIYPLFLLVPYHPPLYSPPIHTPQPLRTNPQPAQKHHKNLKLKMSFHYTYTTGALLLIFFILTVQSSGRDLRPSDHGLTFQNTSAVTDSPDATSFFGGTKSKVPLPEAKNLTDVTWRRSDGVRRESEGVNKAWLVASLVCGVTGIALLSAAAFIFVFRFQMESKRSPISD